VELESIWQSRALLTLKPNANFQTRTATQQKQQEWFLTLVREDIPILMIAAVFGVVMAVIGLAPAVFSQKLIDDFLPNNDIQKIFLGLIGLALLLCIRAVLGYVQG